MSGDIQISLVVLHIDESIRTSKSSLLELSQLLQYVKDKFSEVLLPAECVTRLDFLGKGIVNGICS